MVDTLARRCIRDTHGNAVYLIGNPLVQLSTTAGIVLGLAFVVFAWSGMVYRTGNDDKNDGLERVGRLFGSLYIVLGGWMLHYLPFALVARDCFLTYDSFDILSD
eukprot:COSAG02_NODE_13089_length_1447_cov_1.711424_2_plen_105_part_00